MKSKSLLLPMTAALAFAGTPALAEQMGCMSMMQHGGGEHGGGDHASHGASTEGAAQGTLRAGVRTVDVAVTDHGFEPAAVAAKRGEKVRLVVTRRSDDTCAKEIVIKQYGINRPLPLDSPVTVEFTPTAAGEIPFACAMDMVRGVVVVH